MQNNSINLFNATQYFKNGRKIYIKPSRRGSFTEYCGGKVTDECILRGKNSNDPRIRKKATFALNARNWNKKKGGTFGLDMHNPGIFTEVTLMTNLDFVLRVKKKYLKKHAKRK